MDVQSIAAAPPRTRRIGLAVALLVSLFSIFAVGLKPAAAQERVEIDYFVEALAPHGEWVEHPRHGRVWYPRDVAYDWRPYTLGRWELTEEHGWTWVSDEEWGWAPYHYGRWDYDDRYGWIWVPGNEWGPAWVEWRNGDGYIGWAPLPPAAIWRGDRIYYESRYDYEGPRWRPAWVFVRDVNFLQPRLFTYCEPAARNVTFVYRTRPITSYTVENRFIVNRSLQVNFVERVTQRTIVPLRIQTVSRPGDRVAFGPGGRPAGGGGTLTVFRPIERGVLNPSITRPNPPVKTVTPPPVQPGRPGFGAAPDKPVTLTTPPKAGQPAPVKVDPGANARIEQLRRQQLTDREALTRRQQEERGKATTLQTPGVVQRQFRERSEQRRIEQQQRTVVQSRPVPPQIPQRSGPPPGQGGGGQPAKKPPQGQQQQPR